MVPCFVLLIKWRNSHIISRTWRYCSAMARKRLELAGITAKWTYSTRTSSNPRATTRPSTTSSPSIRGSRATAAGTCFHHSITCSVPISNYLTNVYSCCFKPLSQASVDIRPKPNVGQELHIFHLFVLARPAARQQQAAGEATGQHCSAGRVDQLGVDRHLHHYNYCCSHSATGATPLQTQVEATKQDDQVGELQQARKQLQQQVDGHRRWKV